jgi:putative MATE family efflux protein
MNKSLTKGNPWKLIFLFALPLLFGNLFQQAYNMADAAIVGQTLGANALAAVGATSAIQFLVLGFCMGTCNGFAIPVATSFGAGRMHEMRQSVYTGGILTAVTAVVLTAGTALSANLILRLMQTPAEIYTDTYWYILVIFLGIPCTLLYNYTSAVIRSIGDSRTPFLFLVFSSLLNIGLDFFCILVLKWGVAGAAIATIFSQGVSGLLCLMVMLKKYEDLHFQAEDKHYDAELAKRLIGSGLPMGLQFAITAIGSMVMQAANNSLGTDYVAGLAAGTKINNFIQCPLDAIATATCTFISQNNGALEEKRIVKGLQIGFVMELVWGILGGLILITGGRAISLFFLSASETGPLDASALYLRYVGYFFTLVAILYVTRLSVQGLGWSKRAIMSGAFEMVARIGVVVLLLPGLQYTAICLCDCMAWIFADLFIIPTCWFAMKHAVNEIHGYRQTAAQ